MTAPDLRGRPRQNKWMTGTHLLPTLVRSVDSDSVLRVNRHFTEQFGLCNEDLEARPFLDWIHSEDRSALREAIVAGTGCVSARHETGSGEYAEFSWRVTKSSVGVSVLGMVGKKTLDPSDQAPQSGGPMSHAMGDTLDAMAKIIERKNPGMLCSILLVDEQREYIIGGAGPSLPAAYNKAVEGLRIGPAVGSCGTAAFWNVPVVVEDIATDPLWRDLRGAAEIAGVAACWSHPVTTTEGEVLGAMALYDVEPSSPRPEQMDGLEIAARMVGLAVERDRLEERLRQAAKMEAIGVLAGGIAHDFNNILAVVLGNAELALDTLTEEDEATSMLKEVVTASASAAGLCNQLLAYAGHGALAMEPLDCNALVRETAGLLQVALSKKANLLLDLDSATPWLLADRSQMRQVILNLITNASDALCDKVGNVTIGTEAVNYTRQDIERLGLNSMLDPGDHIRLWVSDTGEGMTADTVARIFDPFFTTKTQGRGLGLAAVQGIVRVHHGAAVVQSERGSGTTISVYLPRVEAPKGATTTEAPSTPESVGGRILVIDDEAGVRAVWTRVLEQAAYKVEEAEDGEQAMELFRSRPADFDCILLDLSMPKLSGDEVFAELRAIRSDIPIILCSGFTEQELLDRFQGAGLTGAIQKPVHKNALLAKVGEALGRA